MNKVMDYIEENLDGVINMDEAAAIMCQSTVSFQRIFSIVMDISIFEYIRKRRMTLAAFEMQNSRSKVIEVAMKYGYESPEAFTRAFKEIHGVSPSVARKEGTQLKMFPRISFLLTVKGDVEMDYRIEKRDAVKIYGIERIFTTEGGKNLVEIPAFWKNSMEDGQLENLIQSTNNTQKHVNAVCQYREIEGNKFPYMLFVFQNNQCDTEGYIEIEIPAGTWAIFKSETHTMEQTSEVIQSLTRRIYTDWLPTASYEKEDGYELEMYYDTDDGKCYCETWIRVRNSLASM